MEGGGEVHRGRTNRKTKQVEMEANIRIRVEKEGGMGEGNENREDVVNGATSALTDKFEGSEGGYLVGSNSGFLTRKTGTVSDHMS